MAYEKTEWKARRGSNLNRFDKLQETARSVILQSAPNSITEQGTPFSVANMNKIEQGIYEAHELIAIEEKERDSANLLLEQAISLESQNRKAADNLLQQAIDAETASRQSADDVLNKFVQQILQLIPTQASAENPLVDRNFVNSSINSLAAFYITPDIQGLQHWLSFAELQEGPWFSGEKPREPSQNDYAFFVNIDPAIGEIDSEWRALFNNGQWYPQFKINDTPFTANQLAALDSGITQTWINDTETELTRIEGLIGSGGAGSSELKMATIFLGESIMFPNTISQSARRIILPWLPQIIHIIIATTCPPWEQVANRIHHIWMYPSCNISNAHNFWLSNESVTGQGFAHILNWQQYTYFLPANTVAQVVLIGEVT
jgi:hypothetical protein